MKIESAELVKGIKEGKIQSKYLADGLVGLAEYLRGDRDREFIQQLNK